MTLEANRTMSRAMNRKPLCKPLGTPLRTPLGAISHPTNRTINRCQ